MLEYLDLLSLSYVAAVASDLIVRYTTFKRPRLVLQGLAVDQVILEGPREYHLRGGVLYTSSILHWPQIKQYHPPSSELHPVETPYQGLFVSLTGDNYLIYLIDTEARLYEGTNAYTIQHVPLPPVDKVKVTRDKVRVYLENQILDFPRNVGVALPLFHDVKTRRRVLAAYRR